MGVGMELGSGTLPHAFARHHPKDQKKVRGSGPWVIFAIFGYCAA